MFSFSSVRNFMFVLLLTSITCFSGKTNFSVTDIITDKFFIGFTDNVGDSCAEKGFYSRSVFFDTLGLYPQFGQTSSTNVSKREVAAFFAHFTVYALNKCYGSQLELVKRCNDYDYNPPPTDTERTCDEHKEPVWPGSPSKTRESSLEEEDQSMSIDELRSHGILSKEHNIVFNASLSFWIKNCHYLISTGKGFGETIRAINGPLECNGVNPSTVNARVRYYIDYCNQLRVSPGGNLSC